ncbi:MAG: hypothetical protein JOY66_01555 [Acetobacteraceae bacterium]|nr:hypothetical protein [Acetobacteraceae bacterium]
MPAGPVEPMVATIEPMVATSQAIARVRASADMQEGIRAHKATRQPSFRGK